MVGSNIFNLMVVVGVCSILTPILVQKETIRRDIPFSMICALLLLGLGILAAGDTIGMRLGHLDGMILLGFFAGYIVAMIQSAMKARAAGKNVDMEGMEELEGEIGILPGRRASFLLWEAHLPLPLAEILPWMLPAVLPLILE